MGAFADRGEVPTTAYRSAESAPSPLRRSRLRRRVFRAIAASLLAVVGFSFGALLHAFAMLASEMNEVVRGLFVLVALMGAIVGFACAATSLPLRRTVALSLLGLAATRALTLLFVDVQEVDAPFVIGALLVAFNVLATTLSASAVHVVRWLRSAHVPAMTSAPPRVALPRAIPASTFAPMAQPVVHAPISRDEPSAPFPWASLRPLALVVLPALALALAVRCVCVDDDVRNVAAAVCVGAVAIGVWLGSSVRAPACSPRRAVVVVTSAMAIGVAIARAIDRCWFHEMLGFAVLAGAWLPPVCIALGAKVGWLFGPTPRGELALAAHLPIDEVPDSKRALVDRIRGRRADRSSSQGHPRRSTGAT